MKRNIIFGIFLVWLLGLTTWLSALTVSVRNKPPITVPVKLIQPEFLMSDNPEKDLPQVLNYYGVMHPDIVRAQAILETGYYRSKVFKKYNNLFGLYDSKNGDYFRFNHWSESVVAYISMIQYRYKPPDDYYHFLQDIGYAEDSLYVSKVKSIVNRIKYD